MNMSIPFGPCWIVIPPVRHDGAWRAAIEKAAAASGHQIYDMDIAPELAPIGDPKAILLTSDAARAVQAGVSAKAVAGLLIESGIRTDPREDPDSLPQDIRLNTELMSRLGLLRPDRIFRGRDFVSGPVEIFPQFVLSPPPTISEPLLSPRQQALADAVALFDPANPKATWSPALFNYNSRRVAGGNFGELDLTGRPRCLLAGPYIVLPAGRWRATYRLRFDPGGSRARFRVDWGGVESFLSEEFVPGRVGEFEIVQEYVWESPAPAEIRLILLEGVFDGRVAFSGAEVSRID